MTAPMLSLASFFSIRAREYTNFAFDEGARATVRTVILAFCVGILVAALYSFYQKQVPGAIVRAILRAEAFSPEAARTAAELGLDKNPLLRFELSHNRVLRSLLRTVEPNTAETPTDEAPAPRYYIPEDLRFRAEIRFDKQGSGLMSLVLTVVLTVVLGILLIKLLPVLLSIVDKIIG